jgi:ring-1,2-phenylacetyl-CoA epoxidase subunit PaaD
MVSETQKPRNAETQKADGRLFPIHIGIDRRSSEDRPLQSTIDNRQSTIRAALESVTDPEIPVISIVDMGMVASVRIDGPRVSVDLTPTFVGCPAVDTIRENVRTALAAIGESDATVNLVFDPPWTSQRITDAGREKLRQFGLAPPTGACTADATSLASVPCPHCGSVQTDLESIFGPTLCRSIHYCRKCLQSFEHFKPI